MTKGEKIAVVYHSIFNYELSARQRRQWSAGPKLTMKATAMPVKRSPGISTEALRETNIKKREIADRASRVLGKIPFVLFVGITGSLAMQNTKPESDIDFMIITQPHAVWVTRVLALYLLFVSGFKLRRAKNLDERDKICLNFWIDTTILEWTGPKNAYIAHEIAQVVPLVNKNAVYERWIHANGWIREYWPRALPKASGLKSHQVTETPLPGMFTINRIMFSLQERYMSSKRTREYVALHAAFFHPYDWGAKVMKELKSQGISEQ